MVRFALSIALILAACSASAQQAYAYWTVEAMTARAGTIVRGVVVDVSLPPTPAGFNAGISVTVKVLSVLKGSAGKTVTFTGNLFGDREKLFNHWKESKFEFLWFDCRSNEFDPVDSAAHVRGLVVTPHMFGDWYAVCLSHRPPEESTHNMVEGSMPNRVLNMDMQACKSASDVLERVKRFVAANPKPVPIVEVIVPKSLPALIDSDFGSDRIVLPMVSEIEPILWRVVQTPATALDANHSPGDETLMRQNCVRCLCYFKSDRNIERMKALLTDPDKVPEDHVPFTPADADRTHYWVRLAAYDVLTLWGVKVRRPQL